MAIKSIPCGGFFYDDESVSFEKDEYGRDVMRAAGGSGNIFAVKFTWIEDESEEGGHYICDKTFEEIKEVILADETVVVAYDGYKVYSVATIEEGSGETNIAFMSYTFGMNNNRITFYYDSMLIAEDNTITERNTEKQIDTH